MEFNKQAELTNRIETDSQRQRMDCQLLQRGNGELDEKGEGIKQKKKKTLIDIDNNMVITRVKGGWG